MLRIFLVMLTAMGLGAASRAATSPPNIVIILTDDQGVDSISGSWWPNQNEVHTPVLSSLASQGRVFRHARVNPLCSPTRAGLQSGRSAFRTGVGRVMQESTRNPDGSLQASEQTLGELLRDAGYFTIFADKWHLGKAVDKQAPNQQGYMVYLNTAQYIAQDDPLETGDEHISAVVDAIVQTVWNRPDPNKPVALVFCPIDPHTRTDPSGREPRQWWKVGNHLLPSGEDYYADDTDLNRYRAVIEAMDTEIGRLLRQLGVIDAQLKYQPQSNTVLFFLSDNGTPNSVAWREGQAKGQSTEGGVLVPMFVFGEGVPADGLVVEDLVQHTDVFATIAEILGNAQVFSAGGQQDSISFAKAIGWGEDGARREYTLSSHCGDAYQSNWVVLGNDRFKLKVYTSIAGLSSRTSDVFYDLQSDPHEEVNLIAAGDMTAAQQAAYVQMRDAIVDYWPNAVALPESHHVDIPAERRLAMTSREQRFSDGLAVGHYSPGRPRAHQEVRTFLRFDLDDVQSVLPDGATLDDVIDAQLILFFESDSLQDDNTRTGLVTAHPATIRWWVPSMRWSDVANAYLDEVTLGMLEVPPFIINAPKPGESAKGLLLRQGTPLSLGRSPFMLEIVRYWHDSPQENDGLVVLAEPIVSMDGDQHINLQSDAILRLTLDPDRF